MSTLEEGEYKSEDVEDEIRRAGRRQAEFYEDMVRGVFSVKVNTQTTKEQTPMKSYDQMNLDELRDAADRFRTKYHFVPNSDQLRQFVNDELWYVQCAFANTKATYTYRVNPGDPVNVGDYLRVWSPATDRHELVRVMEIGRGSWSGHTKTAQRVCTEPID
jgi:hypothetical protein